MPRQTKNILLFFFAMAILVSILLQSACKNDDKSFSHKDFANALKGDWFVLWFSRYSKYPFQSEMRTIQYNIINDSIECPYCDTTKIYWLDDPILCTLPEIENMQKWTITENNNELTLYTIDLCGKTMSYIIEDSNYVFSEGEDSYRIEADVNLIGTDTNWHLMYFYLNQNGMAFRSINDSALYDYVLSR